jgi:hypothetical protein
MYDCNLKAVALKATKRPCEEDSQGTIAGHFGAKYAPAPRGGLVKKRWPTSAESTEHTSAAWKDRSATYP